jgi:hypothetical protein
MQHASLNLRSKNNIAFHDFYVTPINESVSPSIFNNEDLKARIYFIENDPSTMNSFGDWEFFCNELEYE